MKHFFLLTTLIVTMSITHSLAAQSNDLDSKPIEILGTLVFDQQKNCKLVAIDESPGRTMEAGLFAATPPETVKKHMPEGGAPASISSFVLFTGEDTILFDTGNGGELWLKKLTELGVKPDSVKLILLTHMHGDHIGGLLTENVTPKLMTESGLQGSQARRFPNAKILCAKPEYEHWITSQIKITEVEGVKQIDILRSKWSQQIAISMVYGGRDFTTFNFDDIVYENSELKIKAIDAMGHTPGHTAFLIEPKDEKKEKVLIIGDLLHAAALQFPVPEACARFDMDHEKAIASRKRLLDFAAQGKIPIAGMHLPPPHIGTVKKNDQGGYVWEPLSK